MLKRAGSITGSKRNRCSCVFFHLKAYQRMFRVPQNFCLALKIEIQYIGSLIRLKFNVVQDLPKISVSHGEESLAMTAWTSLNITHRTDATSCFQMSREHHSNTWFASTAVHLCHITLLLFVHFRYTLANHEHTAFV